MKTTITKNAPLPRYDSVLVEAIRNTPDLGGARRTTFAFRNDEGAIYRTVTLKSLYAVLELVAICEQIGLVDENRRGIPNRTDFDAIWYLPQDR